MEFLKGVACTWNGGKGQTVSRLPLLPSVVCSMLVWFGCQSPDVLEHEKAGLLRADRECAAASIEAGFAEAYYRCLADNAVVMPPGQRALSGRDEIYATFREQAGGDVLEWEPQDGSVSRSGDLGWTWGNWVFTSIDQEGQSQKSYGKYVFLWNRVGNEWKVIANIWNDSPKPE